MANTNDSMQLENLPAAKPPPGIVPNFVDPYSSGPILISVGSVFVVIMLAFVCVRIYTKVRIVRRSSLDDYTCVIAPIGAVLYFSIVVLNVTIGHFGTHMWDLTVGDVESKAFLVTGFMSNWVTTIVWPFAKLSFFLLYIDLFRPMKWLRYSSYVGATVTVLFYTSVLIATLVFTVPAPGEPWLKVGQSPRHVGAINLTLPIACMSLVLDVYILLLPITAVQKLQLPFRRKMGVMAIFLTGGIACIASSLSIYYKWMLDHNLTDVTYETMPVLLMSLIEMCVGVSASCMPSMNKLLQQLPSFGLLSSNILSRFSSSRGKSSSSEQSRSNGARATYADLEAARTGSKTRNRVMRPVKSMQSYVHTGRPDHLEEDGIHLQVNINQSISSSEQDAVRGY